jgi:hypothetical protein
MSKAGVAAGLDHPRYFVALPRPQASFRPGVIRKRKWDGRCEWSGIVAGMPQSAWHSIALARQRAATHDPRPTKRQEPIFTTA